MEWAVTGISASESVWARKRVFPFFQHSLVRLCVLTRHMSIPAEFSVGSVSVLGKVQSDNGNFGKRLGEHYFCFYPINSWIVLHKPVIT